MSQDTTIEAVGVLAAAYPNANLPDETIRVYVRILSDIPADALAGAITRLVKTSKFIPSISEIRREVAEGMLALPLPGDAFALAARLAREEISSAEVPWVVRETMMDHGGSWTFRTHPNPGVLRGQFERDYAARREARIVETSISLAPEPVRLLDDGSAEPGTDVVPLSFVTPEGADVRHILARRAWRREEGRLDPPTDEEKLAAIAILGSPRVAPGSALHVEAQRILDDADREISRALGFGAQ